MAPIHRTKKLGVKISQPTPGIYAQPSVAAKLLPFFAISFLCTAVLHWERGTQFWILLNLQSLFHPNTAPALHSKTDLQTEVSGGVITA